MKSTAVLLALFTLLATGATEAGELTLTIQEGRVTLRAEDVTVRQILAEWAKVGQTRIVNAERLMGQPVTLQLTGVPERQALDTLLRTVGGYMAAERASIQPGASKYDRIVILPIVTPPPAVATASAARPPGPPGFRPQMPGGSPAPAPMMSDEKDQIRAMPEPAIDDDPPPPAMTPGMYQGAATPGGMTPGMMPPNPGVGGNPNKPETNFNYASPAQMQQLMQQQMNSASPVPAAPGSGSPTGSTPQGAVRPGMIVQPPQGLPPNFRNPYGLPMNSGGPGQAPQGQQPDRSKYANPGQPTPPPPQPPQ